MELVQSKDSKTEIDDQYDSNLSQLPKAVNPDGVVEPVPSDIRPESSEASENPVDEGELNEHRTEQSATSTQPESLPSTVKDMPEENPTEPRTDEPETSMSRDDEEESVTKTSESQPKSDKAVEGDVSAAIQPAVIEAGASDSELSAGEKVEELPKAVNPDGVVEPVPSDIRPESSEASENPVDEGELNEHRTERSATSTQPESLPSTEENPTEPRSIEPETSMSRDDQEESVTKTSESQPKSDKAVEGDVSAAIEPAVIEAGASDSELSAGEKVEELQSFEDSEYETTEPEDDDIEKEGDEDDEDDDSQASDSADSSADSQVPNEREDGDGQECEKKEKKLDHDEDKRDPQYIPKKGNFYEHDDRTSETDEAPPKKPLAQKPYETKERWNHDLYDEDLQSPKSRDELIDQYGYDIRQEEGPPKARRRRRYGRGPNKYTRSWEEVEAYTKGRGSWRGRGRGRPVSSPRNNEEEFPPLPSQPVRKSAQDRLSIKKTEDRKEEGGRASMTSPLTSRRKESFPPKKADAEERKQHQPSPSVKKTFKQIYVEEQVIVPSSRGRGRGRGRSLGSGAPFKAHPSHHQQQHSKHSTAEEDIATLSQHFSEAVINVDNKSIIPITQPQTRASSLPPTPSAQSTPPSAPTTSHSSTAQAPVSQSKNSAPAQDRHHEEREAMMEKSEAKSKRYSTQRQRSLPQGAPPQVPVQVAPQPPQVPPPPQHFIQDQFYHQGGLDGSPGAPSQFSQPPPPPPAAPFTPAEVPMMAFIPPGGQFQPLYVPPPPYLPPAPLPPVQLPQPPPRAEVYQGASGITYYNTQTQVNRPVSTSRRVKLAIPIVAPPESS